MSAKAGLAMLRVRRAIKLSFYAVPLVAVSGALTSTPALPQAASRPAAPSSEPSEAARAAFTALPEAERRAIQDALVWTGDLNSSPTGGYGPLTNAAIRAYQRRNNLKPDGILDAKARAALLSAAERARAGVKFTILTDPATGIRTGIPERILSKRSPIPNGTRWQSADGKITLDLRAVPAGEGTLAELFERAGESKPRGRQVTYKLLRPDFFVVSGETPTGKFYSRTAAGPAGLRSLWVGYDKALSKEFDPVLVAIANAFVPFPESAGAPAMAQPVPTPPARPTVLPPSGPIATAIAVGPGQVLTAASVESCPELRVGSARARIVRMDKAAGLALLEVESPGRVPRAIPIAAETPSAGAALTVLAYGGRPPTLSAIPGEAAGFRGLIAPLQPGAAGAPAFDRAGALAGLVAAFPAAPREVAGIVPPMAHPLTERQALASFLGQSGLERTAEGQAERSTGEIVATFAPAISPVACGP